MQSNWGPLALGVCENIGGRALFWITRYHPLTRTTLASFSLKPPAKVMLKDANYLQLQTVHINPRFSLPPQPPTSFKKYLSNTNVGLCNAPASPPTHSHCTVLKTR